MDKGDQDTRLSIEGRLTFLEEWKTNLTPIQNAMTLADRAAIDFGSAGIKAGFLLNGGALIAVPAFVEILKPGPPAFGSLIYAIGLFVGGLLLCVAVNLAAYLSMRVASVGLVARIDARSAMLHRLYTGDPTGEHKTRETEKDAEADSRAKRADRITNVGLILYLLTIAAFIGGAILSGLLLTSPPLAPAV